MAISAEGEPGSLVREGPRTAGKVNCNLEFSIVNWLQLTLPAVPMSITNLSSGGN